VKANNSILSILSAIALASGLIGCSDNASVDTANSSEATVIDESAQAVDTHTSYETALAEGSEVKKQGFNPSLYQDINKEIDSHYLTYLAVAQHPEKMFDERRLSIIYPEYANEQDTQKKEAMAEELKPKMHAEMAKYEKPYYVKVKLMPQSEGFEYEQEQAKKGLMGIVVETNMATLGSYDFETKSFPLSVINRGSSKNPCWFPLNSHLNRYIQEHDRSIVPNEPCTLEVQDEALAEKLSTKTIKPHGTGYYRIEDGMAYPERVDLTLLDYETEEELATKTFTWSY